MTNEPMPLQWALPTSLEVPPDELQLRLDFFSETIVMYQMEEGVITSRPVSAVDISAAMTRDLVLTSGLLPADTLWWTRTREGTQIAVWRKPQLTRLALQVEAFKPPERFHVPTPGLVFICHSRRPPWVYAAKRRPRSNEDMLYHAPFYNVFRNGRVCPGTHDFPEEVTDIPASFFQSLFSHTGDSQERSVRHPSSLEALWKELDGTKKYPLDDLKPWGPVSRAQEGRGL